jgi:hypothetical protein
VWEAVRHGRRSLGTAEMDEIAGLFHTPVLSATEPTGPKVEYVLGEKLAAEVAQQAADLLAPDPLCASVDLSA